MNPHAKSVRKHLLAAAILCIAVAPASLARADAPARTDSPGDVSYAAAVSPRNIAADALEALGAERAVAGTGDVPPAVRAPDLAEEVSDGDLSVGDVRVGLPIDADAPPAQIGNAAVITGDAEGTSVVAQKIANGARAMVTISDAGAPTRYEFPVTGVSRLEVLPDGSVLGFREGAPSEAGRDQAVIGFAKPWARDASGNDVATHYEVAGTTLVQVVSHTRPGTAYPVTADPTAWMEYYAMNQRANDEQMRARNLREQVQRLLPDVNYWRGEMNRRSATSSSLSSRAREARARSNRAPTDARLRAAADRAESEAADARRSAGVATGRFNSFNKAYADAVAGAQRAEKKEDFYRSVAEVKRQLAEWYDDFPGSVEVRDLVPWPSWAGKTITIYLNKEQTNQVVSVGLLVTWQAIGKRYMLPLRAIVGGTMAGAVEEAVLGFAGEAVRLATRLGNDQCLVVQVDTGWTIGVIPMVFRWTCR